MIVEAVSLFDGTRFTGVHDVELAGSEIAAISPTSRPARGTLLPGFIDAHVHLGFFRPVDVLRAGVTTARDLGWPLGDPFTGGPDVIRAGQILTAPDGYPSRARWAPVGTARAVRTVADAEQAVAEQPGPWIKVAQEPRAGPVLDPDVLRAICDAAHRSGRRVTSHCGSVAAFEAALHAGVDEFAHGLWSDEPITNTLVERSVARGIAIVPTLHVDPYPSRLDNVRRFAEAGGTILYGTDMGNEPARAGIDAIEIDLMIDAGLSLDDALSSATARAAAYLGRDDRGILAPGKRADLVLVDGDPREDVRALEHITAVWKAGVRA